MAALIPGLGVTEMIIMLIILLINVGIPLALVVVLVRLARRSPVPSGAPAGWYPDPSRRHQLRYWTGCGWDAAVSDDGVMSRDQLET